jgi:hypothetical protein
MHPMAGKPAYEWVCYKCYRVIFKKTFFMLWSKYSRNISFDLGCRESIKSISLL